VDSGDLRRLLWSAMLAILFCVLLADTVRVGVNAASIAAAQRRADRASRARDRVQQTDIAQIRALDYRICVRINDTRGVLILALAHDHDALPALVADLPMYECENTIQDGVTLMTASEQAAYLRLLRAGKNPGP
jgi:hypothetical protein